MRKFVNWAHIILFFGMVISFGVMGFKLMNGEYEILVCTYIALGCAIAFIACLLYYRLGNKCPNCGKIRWSCGAFCSYCGKQIEKDL